MNENLPDEFIENYPAEDLAVVKAMDPEARQAYIDSWLQARQVVKGLGLERVVNPLLVISKIVPMVLPNPAFWSCIILTFLTMLEDEAERAAPDEPELFEEALQDVLDHLEDRLGVH